MGKRKQAPRETSPLQPRRLENSPDDSVELVKVVTNGSQCDNRTYNNFVSMGNSTLQVTANCTMPDSWEGTRQGSSNSSAGSRQGSSKRSKMLRTHDVPTTNQPTTNGTRPLHLVLQDLMNRGHFGQLGKVFTPYNRPELEHECMGGKQGHLRYAMELVEACTGVMEQSFLALPPYQDNRKDHRDTIDQIVNLALTHMNHLEGKPNPEQATKDNRKRPGRQNKITIGALGRRVKEHKRAMRIACKTLSEEYKSSKNGTDPLELVPRSEWEAYDIRHGAHKESGSATPQDNTSIRDHFGINTIRNRRMEMLDRIAAATADPGEPGEPQTGFI